MGQNQGKDSATSTLHNSFEFKGHTGNIQTLKFYDGFLYSASKDGTIRQWDAISGACMCVFKGHEGFVAALRFHKDYMYSGSSDGTCRAWNVQSQRQVRVFKGHEKTVSCLCLDTKSNSLFTGSFDHSIRKWDTESGDCELVFSGHKDTITSVELFDGYLYSASADCTIKKWDVETGDCVFTFEGHKGWVMDIAFDGNSMFSCSIDNTIKKWNLKGLHDCASTIEAHQGPVVKIKVSKSGKHLISASWDGNVGVFETGSCKTKHMLKSHGKAVRSLVVLGRVALTGSDDLSARVFDLKKGACLFVLPHGHELVSVAKGIKQFVYSAAKDNIIRKWELPYEEVEKWVQYDF